MRLDAQQMLNKYVNNNTSTCMQRYIDVYRVNNSHSMQQCLLIDIRAVSDACVISY